MSSEDITLPPETEVSPLPREIDEAFIDLQHSTALLREGLRRSGDEGLLAALRGMETGTLQLRELVSRFITPPGAALVSDRSPGPSLASIPAVSPSSADALLPENPSTAILVVDDSEQVSHLLSKVLSRQGYIVRTANSGSAALQLVEQEQFDLILLDVVMPGMGGLQVLETLRCKHELSDLPIIMATAQDASEDIIQAFERGANDYVLKPLDFPVLLARLQTHLALKRAKAQLARLNLRLEESQKRIDWLLASSAQAFLDVSAWTKTVAADVAQALDAESLTVWLVEGDDVRPMSEQAAASSLCPPSRHEIQAAHEGVYHPRPEREDETVIPVRGLGGDLHGALLIRRAKPLWDEMEKRLVNSFSHQLGGALELQRVRTELTEATQRRKATMQMMVERGEGLLQFCPQCARCYDHAPKECAVDSTPLRTLGQLPHLIERRYQPLQLLGVGGSGWVFEAQDQRLGRRVALKVIRAEHFDDESIRRRFENEARAVARINHPGVATVYDSGELEGGSLYIVMELLEGCDLGRLIRAHGPGTPGQVATLLRQGGAALVAAHQLGLVHRDLKPENLLIVAAADRFRVKLLDFGSAKEIARDSNLSLNQSNALVGTPAYMSPEQITGQKLDYRSDIYSFAAVAYEALTGRRVTQGSRLYAIFVDIVLHHPPLVSTLLEDCPLAVDDSFNHALAKTVDSRPASIEDWVKTLADRLASIPSHVAGWPTDAEGLRATRNKYSYAFARQRVG